MLAGRKHHILTAPLAALALICLTLAAAPRAAAESPAALVSDLRVGDHGDKTRFVLDMSAPTPFTLFTLADPYRLVIDLPRLGWRLPQRPLPKNVGLIGKLRYGLFKPDVTRVVLDMTGPARVKQAMLLGPRGEHPYRLVVDLAETSRRTFMAELEGSERTVSELASGKDVPDIDAGAATQTASVRFPPPPPKPTPRRRPAKKVVVIDPGHGGVDPGTIGTSGVYEKNVVLSMARQLASELERTGRYEAVLTRDRDIFLRLRQRVEIARKAGADLFLSLHADSIKNKRVRGLSVYTLSETASDREAAKLAEKENKSDLIAGVDLGGEEPEVANILIDLAQRESMNQSAHFAARLVRELQRDVKLLRNSHRFAGFAVLKAPDVPSVLIELGFLSNRYDERNLRSRAHRRKVATGIREAIDRYFARVEEASRL